MLPKQAIRNGAGNNSALQNVLETDAPVSNLPGKMGAVLKFRWNFRKNFIRVQG
jgi:hypothetical protein